MCLFNLSREEQPAGYVPVGDMQDLLSRDGRLIPGGSLKTLAPSAAHWLKAV